MSKKKARKQTEQGVYALCMTVGAIVGFGLGAIIGNVLLATALGLGLGGLVAYMINRPGNKRRKT